MADAEFIRTGHEAEQEKLVDWEKPPTVRELKEDMEMAQPENARMVKQIKNWLKELRPSSDEGKTEKKRAGRSNYKPKLIRKQAEWRYSSLSEPFLSNDDIYDINPVSYEDVYGARQNKLILNNQFNTKIDKVKLVDETVRVFVDEGWVVHKVGWNYETETVVTKKPIYNYRVPTPQEAMLLQNAMQLQQQDPGKFQAVVKEHIKHSLEISTAQGQLIMAQEVGVEEIEEEKIIHNHPTVEVCDYEYLYIDPTCKGHIEKASFVIYGWETCLADLRKDSRYKNLDLINVTNNLADTDSSNELYGANFSDKERTKFTIWEYWGLWDINGDGRLKPIHACWVGDVMVRMEENPYPDRRHPFVAAHYMPVRNKINGEPDGELLLDNQNIIGATTRGMIDLMARSANGQTGIAKNALDVVNRRKYERGEDFEYNPQIDPARAFYMHKFPEIPNAAPLMLQHQNSEAESLTGVTAFSKGLQGQSLGDTATGVRGVLDAASKRELGILRRLGNSFIEIARKIIAMNAEFLSEEEVVRVTNDDFVTIRRDDLAGNYDLRLSISTAESDNQKAEELSFLLQTMGPNLDIKISLMIMEEIAILRKMPKLAKKIREWQPEPDPMLEKEKELKNLLLEAQIQEVYSRIAEGQASSDLDRAKAITERAKAINLQADTDIKNLDYVEQESGVTQERDLQKQGAQARANAQLEVLKSQLNPRKQ